MKYLFLLLSLLASSSANCQSTKPSTRPASKSVCIPELAARKIYSDLRRYPLVVKERNKLRSALGEQEKTSQYLRSSLADKDSAIVNLERQAYFAGLLQQDAQANATVWKAKARKRSWVIVGLTSLLVGTLYVAVAR